MSRFYYSVYGSYIEQYLDVQRSLGYKPKERNSILVSFDRLALERDEAVVGYDILESLGKVAPVMSVVNVE